MLSHLMAAGGGVSLGTLMVRLTADATSLVKGMKQAETTIGRSSAVMLTAVAGMAAGMTAAFGAVAVAGVREFARFEEQMVKSTAIMGNVSATLRKEMEATARSIARETVTSADKLAESYYFLASAGLDAKQSMAALGTVNKFAIAGAFDMAKATDLLTDAQSALGLTVRDDVNKNTANMVRLSDALVKANNLANASVLQFSESLTTRAGAALRAVNKDAEEGLAVLSALADQGVKGAEAGNQLAIILRDLQKASIDNRAEFDRLGIQVFDSSGEINNLAVIVSQLERALRPMSTEMKRATFETLGFQDRSLSAILSLLGTSDAIARYETELRKAGGTTEEVADKQMESFNSQMKILWNQIKDLLMVVGEMLMPVLKALNEMLKAVKGNGHEMSEGFKDFCDSIAPAVVSAIGFIGDAIQGLLLGSKMVRMGFQYLGAVLLETFAKIGPVIAKGIATIVNGVIEGVNATIRALNLLLPKAKEVGEIQLRLTATGSTEGMELMAQGLRASAEENFREIDEMVTKGAFSSRFRAAYEKITNVVKEENAEMVADTKKTVAAMNQAVEELGPSKMEKDSEWAMFMMEGMEPSGSKWAMGDWELERAAAIGHELAAAQNNLAILQEINQMDLELTEEAQARKLELLEAYNEEVAELQRAQMEIVLQSAEAMFADLSTIAEGFAGRQSGLYKAMFAASKAFAIAESIVKIQQGIAAAASIPWPANLAAIASVVAATANIVSTIQAVKLEFGGKREKGGPVSAGKSYLVGERGPEMFTPSSQGSITPNDELGGGREVKVVIHNYTDARPEVSERTEGNERIIDVVLRRVKNEIGSEIRDGRGDVSRALESSFNLRRGR